MPVLRNWRRRGKVYITGRRQQELDAAIALIGTSAKVRADVSRLEDTDKVYAQIAEESGRLDILFANAGGGDMLALGAITEEHFDRIFGTNVRGLFTVQKALPLLGAGSSIILTASTVSVKGRLTLACIAPAKPQCETLLAHGRWTCRGVVFG